MRNALEARRAAIEAGDDPNARDSQGRTVLHLAIATKDTDTVRFLLDRGADWELADHAGRPPTAAMYAEERKPWGVSFKLKRGYKAILGLLQREVLRRPCSLTFLNQADLFNAALDGRVADVQDALEDGGVWNVNVQLEDGSTPLHLAVERGHARVVVALLGHHKELADARGLRTWPGPDLGLRNVAGETVRDIARRVGNIAILDLLEAHAARGGVSPQPEPHRHGPDALVANVIATTQTILEQARDLEGLLLPVPGLTFLADELSCAAVVVAREPWTAPHEGRKVQGRFVTEAQAFDLAEALGLDPREALDRLLQRVAARLRRDGAPFLEAGGVVVCVEHGGLVPDRMASAAAEAALAQAWSTAPACGPRGGR